MKKLYFILLTVVLTGAAFAQNTVVKFQADIANRNGDILFIKQGRIIVKEIKADSNGFFKDEFSVQDGMYQLFDGAEYAELFLKNGYDLKMKMDAKQFDETIKFSGKGEAENNYLAQNVLADNKYDYDGLLAKDEATFNKMLEEKKSADLAKLNNPKLDPAFVTLQKQTIEKSTVGIKKYYDKKLGAAKMNNTPSAPFDYENYNGSKTSLASLKGKYVYIDVWATWCGPCRQELPYLKQMEEKYHGKNIEFVSISVDRVADHDKWKQFVTEKELKGTQLFADNSFNSDFIKAYGIDSIPRFILIDPSGKIVSSDADRPSNPQLQVQLDKLLN
ncbi:MAG: TlpA family protein disulfide reductase [Flavobacterium sp.]